MTDDEAAMDADEPDPEPAAADEEPLAESEESAEDGEAEPDANDDEGGLSDGDFVTLSYTMRTAEDGTLVDTTEEEVAEEEGIDTEEREFGPRTVVIGAGHVFGSVESALQGQSVGDTGTVVVSPAEAFGEYDPDQMRTVSTDKIPEDDRYPGAHVTIDGEQGHIETIIGGRSRVDFNHPLAGEEIEYDYEIVDVVEDRQERAEALVSAYLDMDLDVHFGTETEEQPAEDEDDEPETVERETLYIEATPQLSMNQQWLFSKQQIASELVDRLGIDQVVVREVLGGAGGLGGMMGGLGGLNEADLDDVDADEIVEELGEDMDIDEELDVDELDEE